MAVSRYTMLLCRKDTPCVVSFVLCFLRQYLGFRTGIGDIAYLPPLAFDVLCNWVARTVAREIGERERGERRKGNVGVNWVRFA